MDRINSRFPEFKLLNYSLYFHKFWTLIGNRRRRYFYVHTIRIICRFERCGDISSRMAVWIIILPCSARQFNILYFVLFVNLITIINQKFTILHNSLIIYVNYYEVHFCEVLAYFLIVLILNFSVFYVKHIKRGKLFFFVVEMRKIVSWFWRNGLDIRSPMFLCLFYITCFKIVHNYY